MKISEIDLGGLEFPGRAGRLQQQGATAALIRELGDNYSAYNEYLAGEMKDLGGAPDPADYELSEYDQYLAAATRARDIVAGEIALRRSHAYRKHGHSLEGELEGPPVLDRAQRVLSVETGKPALDYPGSRRALERKPATPPDVARTP